jgi:hypothetical protein
MTNVLPRQVSVLCQLRLIACAALIGISLGGIVGGFFDSANIDTYRSIGAAVGAFALIATGAYRIL